MEIRCENDGLWCTIIGVQAGTESAAFEEAVRLLPVLVGAVSVDVQAVTALNQHYGNVRLAWRARDVEILPSDSWPAAGLSIKAMTRIQATRAQSLTDLAMADDGVKMILNSFYQAIGPADLRSKYYSGFVVIEYLEAKFTKRVRVDPLPPEDVRARMNAAAAASLDSDKVANPTRNRVLSRIGLSNATLQSRAIWIP